ncbi:MAG: AAA family ATPase [Bacteroidota bacterium]
MSFQDYTFKKIRKYHLIKLWGGIASLASLLLSPSYQASEPNKTELSKLFKIFDNHIKVIAKAIGKENQARGRHKKVWLSYPKFKPFESTLKGVYNLKFEDKIWFSLIDDEEARAIGALLMLFMERYTEDYHKQYPGKKFCLGTHTRDFIDQVARNKQYRQPRAYGNDTKGIFENEAEQLSASKVQAILNELITNTDSLDMIFTNFTSLLLSELERGQENARIADENKELKWKKKQVEQANEIKQAILEAENQHREKQKKTQEQAKQLNQDIVEGAKQLAVTNKKVFEEQVQAIKQQLVNERLRGDAQRSLEAERVKNAKEKNQLQNEAFKAQQEIAQRRQELANIEAEGANKRRSDQMRLDAIANEQQVRLNHSQAKIKAEEAKLKEQEVIQIRVQAEKHIALKQKEIELENARAKKYETLTHTLKDWKMMSIVGGIFVTTTFFFKLIPFILKGIFKPKPKIITKTSLPTSLKEKIERLLFGKKKEKSVYHLMAYNDEIQEFVDKEIVKTIAIHKKNKQLRSGENPYNHENILLYGPPGTGKTMLALEIARNCGMDYTFVNTPLLAKLPVNKAVAMMQQIFEYVAQFRTPVIIIFDELDAVFGSREKGTNIDRKIVNTLLGYIARKNNPYMKLIGLTNLVTILDDAVIVRMRRQKISRPNAKTLEKQLLNYMKDVERKGTRVSIEVKKSLARIARLLEQNKAVGSYVQGMFESLRTEADFISPTGQIELKDMLNYIHDSSASS